MSLPESQDKLINTNNLGHRASYGASAKMEIENAIIDVCLQKESATQDARETSPVCWRTRITSYGEVVDGWF